MIPIAQPAIGEEEIRAVTDVLRSGNLVQGDKVKEFEQAFARLVGTKYAVAVNSGTAALHIALLAHGIGNGDEVITSPFSFIATANSVLFTGAKPVFADIEEETFNISAGGILGRIGPETKAIMPVHLYGQPCDMEKIMEIAGEHNLAVIEDACQAHGASFKGSMVGSFGTGCFSFYATKNMVTGEGGMITTDNEEIADKARMLRNQGQKERYLHKLLGYNYRMTDIAAAIGLVQLKKLPEFIKKRQENANYLSGKLKVDGITTPSVASGCEHVFHLYTVRVTDECRIGRDELARRLNEKGIGAGIYYPLPIHKQPLYSRTGFGDSLPVSEKLSGEVLSLPVHPQVSRGDLDFMVDVVMEACR
ncbi:GDP-perosamine synthase [subsurface metagenome]